MMGTAGIELTLQLAIAALAHVSELHQLIATAVAEGRDVTSDEIMAVRARAVSSVDALDAQNRAGQP
jgi:hypothetical protein